MNSKILIIAIQLCIGFGPMLYGQNDTLSYSIENNKLRPNVKFSGYDTLLNQYSIYHGVMISKYYQLTDSLSVDSVNINPQYRILILTPISQIRSVKISLVKRLIVVLKNIKGKYEMDYVNENVILEMNYSQDPEPLCGIKQCDKGFSLCFFFGSINKCEFTFYFNLERGNFYLNRYTTDCYITDFSQSEKKEQMFNTNLEKRNLRYLRTEDYIGIPPELGQ